MAKNFYVSLDLFQNQLLKAVIENATTAPSTPVRGQLFYSTGADGGAGTVAGKMYYWNGSKWQDMTGVVQDIRTNNNILNITNTNGVYTLTIVPGNINHADLGNLNAVENPHNVNLDHVLKKSNDAQATTITNLPDPQNPTEAVNKRYVDNIQTGLNWHDPVNVATTAAIDLTVNVTPGTTVIDGYTIQANNRVLIKDQGASAQYSTFNGENGIYIVPAAAGVLTRAADADTGAELNNATVLVLAGTAHAGDVFSQTETLPPGPIDGATPIHFAPISTGVTITAGAGMVNNSNSFDVVGVANRGIMVNADDVEIRASDLAGNGLVADVTNTWQLIVNADDDSLEIVANVLGIKDDGVKANHIDATELSHGLRKNASDGNKIDVRPYEGADVKVVPVKVVRNAAPDIGVGIPIDNDSIQLNGSGELMVNNNSTLVVRKYSINQNINATTATPVAHGLNTPFVTVAVYEPSGGSIFDEVGVHVQVTDNNTVNITSSKAISNANIVIIG